MIDAIGELSNNDFEVTSLQDYLGLTVKEPVGA
jgi:hypothetical protein